MCKMNQRLASGQDFVQSPHAKVGEAPRFGVGWAVQRAARWQQRPAAVR